MYWGNKIIVVDTETTGLNPLKHTIVSIGACLVEDMKITDYFYSICWPGRKFFKNGIADKALQINGLSLQELINAPSTIEVVHKFLEWLYPNYPNCDSDLKTDITAYNAQFDKGMLSKNEWDALKCFDWKACIMLECMKPMKEGKKLQWVEYRQDYKWPKLSEASEFFGIINPNPHLASGDAETAALILIELQKYNMM